MKQDVKVKLVAILIVLLFLGGALIVGVSALI
jgi:hypothetical protein